MKNNYFSNSPDGRLGSSQWLALLITCRRQILVILMAVLFLSAETSQAQVTIARTSMQYATLQEAVAAALDGDVLSVKNGTYTLSSTLYLNHELIINGESEAGVTIDLRSVPAAAWGINPNKSNTTLTNMTIIPRGTDGGYPIHVGDNMVPVVISNVTLSHITIDGAKKTAFDFNGVDHLTLSYLTAKNSASGNGVQVSGCTDVHADHITTLGNSWGGFAVYSSQPVPGGVGRGSDHVTIDGSTSSFGENNKVYNQNEFGYTNTNITITGFDYMIQNSSVPGYTYYLIDRTSAFAFAAAMPSPANSVVKQISTGEYCVNTNTSIQNLINTVPSGSTVNLTNGTYSAFTVDRPMTISGASGVKINHGSPAITVAASGVTITGITFDYPEADYAIDVLAGAYNVNITNCTFLTTNAVRNQGTGTVTVNGNYWGTILQSKITPKISGNVTYNSWQGQTVSPVNGLTGVTIGLDKIDWSAFGNGTYEFTIYEGGPANGPNMGVQLGNGNVTTTDLHVNIVSPQGTALCFLPLKNNTTYYWYVKQKDLSPAYWDELHFTTIPSVEISLNNPADQSAVYTSSAMFTWNTGQSNNGLTFVLQLYQHDNIPTEAEWANNAVQYSVTTTYKTVNGLIAGKPYFWRVLAKKTSTGELVSYSSVYSFNTTGGSTVTVTPSWPVGGEPVYTNSPTLYWYLDQAATGLTYYIKYSSISNAVEGSGELSNGTEVSTSSGNLYYILSNLNPGTTYYWQVKAIYSAGSSESAWSTPESFVTQGRGTLQVPIASYPVDGEPVYTTSPTIYWYLGTTASGLYYDIDIATSSNGEDGTADYSTTTADQLFKKISNLIPGQTYYYKIRSKNVLNVPDADHRSQWSNEASFVVVGGTTQSYPVTCEPIGNPTIYSARPILSWYLEGSNLGITGYKIKYTKNSAASGWNNAAWAAFDPGMPNDATDGQATRTVNQTSWTVNTDLTYGATYYWAVTATNSSSESVYSVGSFTVVGGPGQGDPIQSQPENGSIVYSTSVRLSWFVNGTTAGINGYDLVYSKSDLFDPAVTTTVHPTTQYYNATQLTPGATYYWKVQARYPGGITSNSSPVWSFTVQVGSALVVQPIVGGPNNIMLNTTSPTLTWVLPAQTTANLQYEVQVAENQNFLDAKVINASKTNIQVNSLSGNKNYYWRVRSKGSDGIYSYYSNIGKFSVDNTTTGVERTNEIPSQFILDQNYPNPFNPTTMIRFELPKDALVTLKIYNVLGQEVKTLMSAYKSAGTYNVQWKGEDNSGSKVQSGTYIYRIVAGDYVSAKKMIMLK